MRLCRFGSETHPRIGFYTESGVIALDAVAATFRTTTGQRADLPISTDLLDYLPPDGAGFPVAKRLAAWLDEVAVKSDTLLPDPAAPLLVPIPRPNKLLLLAGNYADHIREGGELASERAETFPYVFLKPASTTLTRPGEPIRLPRTAPDAVDWELELGVIIGRRGKHVTETDALDHVAGYTIINDISQRRFRPNPGRKKREKDGYFDWLHGKWFDSFCCIAGAVASADAIPNPQALRMRLDVNGGVKQDASTAQMIFPVAAIIEFISSICTLEPGDIISTGTPAGVGSTTGTFLKPGDVVACSIEGIGVLSNPVESED